MITVVINGQNYYYPEVGDTDWGSIATLAFDAITKTTLQPVKDLNDPTAVNDFTLYNDIDFGPTHGLRVLFIQSRSNNPAASGVFRLAKDELVAWRNEDNDGDNTISFDSDGDLIVNGVKVTLHGQIVNDDIAAAAGIEESKLALDHSTQSLYDNIENHKSDTANPHLTNLVNLVDTTIITPADNDTLLYDGNDSKWKNIPNTVANVKDVTISSVADGDVLVYDSNDSDWKNSDVVSSHVSNTSNPHSVTKAQVLTGDLIVNADVDASAAIAESKLDLDYSTDSLNTAITNHTSDTNNPHSTSVSNLTDTTISGVGSGDVLTYDGSKWVNAPSSSASLSGLSDTAITTPADGDVLVYDSVSTKWENSDQLSTLDSTVSTHVASTSNPHSTKVSNLDDVSISSVADGDILVYDSNDSEWKNSDQLSTLDSTVSSHVGNTSNPHSTKVSNLTDTTISSVSDKDTLLYDSNSSKWVNVENSLDNLSNTDIDSDTLAENDVMVFNDQTSKWENSQILVNHIGNAANPHLTTVSKLTDTSITTPSDKQLLQYDQANLQWVNSSDVWTQIEINDIANINSATTNVTFTASDKRHQIFTASNGFNITLPSTGIKAGEKFVFDWTSRNINSGFNTPFVFYVGSTIFKYANTGLFTYIFRALSNNPSSTSDWKFEYTMPGQVHIGGFDYKSDLSYNANDYTVYNSSALYSLANGVWSVKYNLNFINGGYPDNGNHWAGALRTVDDNSAVFDYVSNSMMGVSVAYRLNFGRQLVLNWGGPKNMYQMEPYSKTGIVKNSKKTVSYRSYLSLYSTSAINNGQYYCSSTATLISPIASSSYV